MRPPDCSATVWRSERRPPLGVTSRPGSEPSMARPVLGVSNMPNRSPQTPAALERAVLAYLKTRWIETAPARSAALALGAIVTLAVLACRPATGPHGRPTPVNEPSVAIKPDQRLQAELDEMKAELSSLAELGSAMERETSTALATRAICKQVNCRKRCCRRIGTITLCEPHCKSLCELRNLGCNPSICSAIKAADPSYDTLRSAWQTARDRDAFCDKAGCLHLADMGSTAGEYLCSFLGGGLFCKAGDWLGREENTCICSELDYRGGCRSGGGPPLGGRPPLECKPSECCERRNNGECAFCKPPRGQCP